MKRKSSKFSGQRVVCNKCLVEGHGVAGKKHRRCGGSEGASIRAKHDALDGAEKGTWQ